METLTIILSGLLTLLAPAGLILDTVAENNLRSRLDAVGELQVRIDNTPSYQVLQGKIERLRFASRDVSLRENFKLDTLEIETDEIDVDLAQLRQGKKKDFRAALNQPLQAGIRLVLTETNLNQTLQSPQVQARIEKILNRLLKERGNAQVSYTLSNPQLSLLGNNRFSFQAELTKIGAETAATTPLELKLELGVRLISGRRIELIEPTGSINGKPLSPQLLNGFAQGVSARLDLFRLEKNGILARFLSLEIGTDTIEVAGFMRLETLTKPEI